MVVVSYTNGSNSYKVEMITTTDTIEQDMIDALADIDVPVNRTVYKQKMRQSVKQGLAYAVYKDGERVGFVYNVLNGIKYQGASIMAKGYDVMILAFKTMFDICDAHKIEFVPHGDNFKQFMSLISGSSIRAWYMNCSPLVVIRDAVYTKGERAFKYLGMKEV